mgnify:CR=1 FL=1
MKIRHFYRIFATLPILVISIAFLFRATFYWGIPVPENEPKGGGEVIEILLFLLLLVCCSLSILLSALLAVIPKIRNYQYSIRLLAIGVAVPIIYKIFHSLIPRLM